MYAVDLIGDLFGFDYSEGVYFDLKDFHPADSANRILGKHAGNKSLQKGRDLSGKLQIFAVEDLDEIGN